MSTERGMAAIRLEMPDEIPHTQYVTHPAWIDHLRRKAGTPQAGIEELLDFDFRWSTDGPTIPRGRWCAPWAACRWRLFSPEAR